MRSEPMSSHLIYNGSPSKGTQGDQMERSERESILMGNLDRLDPSLRPSEKELDLWRSQPAEAGLSQEEQASHRALLRPITEQIEERCRGAVILEGINPPWILQELLEAGSPSGHPSFYPRILVLQSDMSEFLDGLSWIDLGSSLGHQRICWFVGDDAAQCLLDWADQRIDDAPPAFVIQNPALKTRSSPDGPALMREIDARWTRNTNELIGRLKRRGARDQSWWVRRYGCAGQDQDPMRVLIPVSMHTTYLKHTAADLAEAFAQLGCECRVLMERDESTVLSQSSNLRAIIDFDPDLILAINYTRSALGDAVPSDIPFVCWVQDAMAHLFDHRIGGSLGDRDFIVGMVKTELVEQFDYPKEQTRWMPMIASKSKFSASSAASSARGRFESEIAWVTHQSEHPDLLCSRLISDMKANAPDAAARFEEVLGETNRIVTTRPHARIFLELHRLVDEAFFPTGIPADAHGLRSNMLNTLVIPYAERVFRHQVARWAADLASRHGWRFKLYGNGWENHPQLAEFAAGPIEHGEELSACYRGSVVHLHASLNQVMHQRVSECLLSGGLPICRVARDAYAMMNNQAAAWAFSNQIGEPTLDADGEMDGWRVVIGSCPHALSMIEQLRRLDLCRTDEYHDETIWWPRFKVEAAIASLEVTGERKNTEMFASMSDLYFANENQLEGLIERAIEDSLWRRDRVDSAVSEMPAELTADGFVKDVLAMIRSSFDPKQAG